MIYFDHTLVLKYCKTNGDPFQTSSCGHLGHIPSPLKLTDSYHKIATKLTNLPIVIVIIFSECTQSDIVTFPPGGDH